MQLRVEMEKEGIENHHFRLSLNIVSVSSLKRAAHLCIQYSYPFFGSSHMVRTRPVWARPNTVIKVEGAASVIDCYMTDYRFEQILTDNPLKVSAFSRTNMGNEVIGEGVISFESLLLSEPVSFRCPISGKTFKTRESYDEYREKTVTLHTEGKGIQVPPKIPIHVKASNLKCPLLTDISTVNISSGISDTGDKSSIQVMVAIEDLGIVGSEIAHVSIPSGLNDQDDNDENLEDFQDENNNKHSSIPSDPLLRVDISDYERRRLEVLKMDWEAWRKVMEAQWKASLLEKENSLRVQIEQELAHQFVERARDLKKNQEETAKLEIRLRSSLEQVERQKNELLLKEEQMNMRLAQKTAELQLLQKRVREEAKISIENESRRADSLEKQLRSLQHAYDRLEKRSLSTENEFENFRQLTRNTPETLLREENARLKGQLSECRAEIEKEKRVQVEMEMEKEHFRSQMQRLALALKREREKTAVMARQDLEQLRLEFLAREERYVLDGDRQELNSIRLELAGLKQSLFGSGNGYTDQ